MCNGTAQIRNRYFLSAPQLPQKFLYPAVVPSGEKRTGNHVPIGPAFPIYGAVRVQVRRVEAVLQIELYGHFRQVPVCGKRKQELSRCPVAFRQFRHREDRFRTVCPKAVRPTASAAGTRVLVKGKGKANFHRRVRRLRRNAYAVDDLTEAFRRIQPCCKPFVQAAYNLCQRAQSASVQKNGLPSGSVRLGFASDFLVQKNVKAVSSRLRVFWRCYVQHEDAPPACP